MVVPERWGAAPAAEDRRTMGFVYLLDELAWACALLEPAAADCRATRRRGLGVVDGWCGLEAALVLWRWGFEGMVAKLDLFLEPMLGCPLGVRAPWRGGGVGVGSAAFVGPEDELVVQVREVVPVLAPRLRPSPGLVLLWPRLGSLLLHHCRLSASRGGLMLPS
jgi:hypothetical protein